VHLTPGLRSLSLKALGALAGSRQGGEGSILKHTKLLGLLCVRRKDRPGEAGVERREAACSGLGCRDRESEVDSILAAGRG